MTLRAVAASAALAASLLLLSGCLAPAPDPTPTPTAAFASEEEAFAAAEQTYRAYIDADNARRSNPNSVPDPQSFLVGQALEDDIDATTSFDQLGLRLIGDTEIRVIDFVASNPVLGDVQIDACIDATQTKVLDSSGKDVTKSDRDPLVTLRVDMTTVGRGLLIEKSVAVESATC